MRLPLCAREIPQHLLKTVIIDSTITFSVFRFRISRAPHCQKLDFEKSVSSFFLANRYRDFTVWSRARSLNVRSR
jgi:hypothetical protein